MRLFKDLDEAANEITRDLTKAPEVLSERVQNQKDHRMAHEQMFYDYTILAGGIPHRAEELVELGSKYFTLWKGNRDQMTSWLKEEAQDRIHPESALRKKVPADAAHPELATLKEGEHYGYTYYERLLGMNAAIVASLYRSRTTRRAFWPIFREQDAIRSSAATRIPCTIGYDFLIRQVPEQGALLHCGLIQRSVDFEKFWLSDVWFAYRLQKSIADTLDMHVGNLSHIIFSFHMFEGDSEVY